MSDSEPSTIGTNPTSYADIALNGDYAGQDITDRYGAHTTGSPTLLDNPRDNGDNGTGDSGNGAVDIAKQQAASVGHGAAAAGQQVAATAKDQAQNVAAEAATQARDLIGQARTELTDQASTQQKRLAEGLRALGDELHSMASNSDRTGVATDMAHQGAGKVHEVASWLDGREPGALVSELRGFARQRPLAFLALAAGAGVLAGRLTRGLQAASSDDDAATSAQTTVTRAPVDPAAAAPDVLFGNEAQPDPARPFASSQDGASVDGHLGDRR